MDVFSLTSIAGIIAYAVPVLFAAIGENFTEKSGIINLSVNGTIILTAMAGFVVALNTGSIFLGFLVGAVIGALIASIVAFSSITLKQSQVAIGFVLALLCRDLGYFLGAPYSNKPGLFMTRVPITGLSEIPIVGTIFFNHTLLVYFSYIFIFAAFIYMYKTRPGLMLQGIGEKPASAFVRGANVNALRYFYTILGGALIGLAGPMYSLAVKIGWAGQLSGLDGIGWIALAITIFGGWHPLRVVCSCAPTRHQIARCQPPRRTRSIPFVPIGDVSYSLQAALPDGYCLKAGRQTTIATGGLLGPR